MPDPITSTCATAAAAAASACGLPPDISLLAALGGAAVGTWLRHGQRADLTLRGAVTIGVHVLGSAGFGLSSGAIWSAMVPAWASSSTAPPWVSGAALVPAWAVVVLTSGLAHALLPLAGRMVKRFIGGGATGG